MPAINDNEARHIGSEIDDISIDLDRLSHRVERLAEKFSGRPGPRGNQKAPTPDPRSHRFKKWLGGRSLAMLSAEDAAAVGWDACLKYANPQATLAIGKKMPSLEDVQKHVSNHVGFFRAYPTVVCRAYEFIAGWQFRE